MGDVAKGIKSFKKGMKDPVQDSSENQSTENQSTENQSTEDQDSDKK